MATALAAFDVEVTETNTASFIAGAPAANNVSNVLQTNTRNGTLSP